MRTLSILLAVALFFAGATAQSNDCSSTLVSLSPCLNYITGNSSSPSSSCCAQLSTVVKSQPACLCQVINGGGGGLGINVNQTQALALPGACKVQTPPTSQCNGNSQISFFYVTRI
ncbi:Non-specific lipid transfer protein GPI-anchored 5 [Linum perenne]